MSLIDYNKDSSFELDQVITLYKRENGQDAIKENYYLESHNVLKKNGANILCEGRPLSLDCLGSLSHFLHGKDNHMIKGFIPKRLLYQNPNIGSKRMIWYRAAQQTHLKFGSSKALPKDGTLQLPTLVFMAQEHDLYVFSTKSSRPTPKTRLYHAPLLNTNINGKICLGTTRSIIQRQLPLMQDLENVLNFWEEMFFASQFNTGEGNGDSNIACKEGLIKTIKHLQNTGEDFNTELLVQTKQTIEDLTH